MVSPKTDMSKVVHDRKVYAYSVRYSQKKSSLEWYISTAATRLADMTVPPVSNQQHTGCSSTV